MPPSTTPFAATRSMALACLAAFVPSAGRYSRDRNKVVPGHVNVSRLSPAIRHGLVSISECQDAILRHFAPSTVEKFVQELHWRRYWKAWLSLRPAVWRDYCTTLDALRQQPDAAGIRERARQCEDARSAIAIMNHFARELTETGYLHNHARMWFAGWWIHVERLPWQLGADFFLRHLLDADPASNTLSWRWVAGLQTPGKTYLPRRTNIAKYVDPGILDKHSAGLDLLASPQALLPGHIPTAEITHPDLEDDPVTHDLPLGIWIHEEDLLPEHGPLSGLHPTTILCAGFEDGWKNMDLPAPRQSWLRTAISDANQRATVHFQCPCHRGEASTLQERLCHWVRSHELAQVVALRPEVGPLADHLPALRGALADVGATLRLLNRSEDLAIRPHATAGFFRFWKKAHAEIQSQYPT